MFFEIANNGITLRIHKKTYGFINQLSIPMDEILNPGSKLCISGTSFGKIFLKGENIQTKITAEEVDNISQGDAIPLYIWFFPFRQKGYMAVNFYKDGKDQSVAVPVEIVAEKGIEI
jgi:hypothetical protein